MNPQPLLWMNALGANEAFLGDSANAVPKGVNFINIKRTHFSFEQLHFGFEQTFVRKIRAFNDDEIDARMNCASEFPTFREIVVQWLGLALDGETTFLIMVNPYAR